MNVVRELPILLVLSVSFFGLPIIFIAAQTASQEVAIESPENPPVVTDTTPPSIPTVEFLTPRDAFPPVFQLHSTDQESGISHYDIQLENGTRFSVAPPGIVQAGFGLDPATYLIQLTAWDNANNSSNGSFNISIPGAPALSISNPPPAVAYADDLVTVEGGGIPGAEVVMRVTPDTGSDFKRTEFRFRIDENGSFSIPLRYELAPGAYNVTFQQRVQDGRLSPREGPFPITSRPYADIGVARINPSLLPYLLGLGLIGTIGFMFTLIMVLTMTHKKSHLNQKIINELQA